MARLMNGLKTVTVYLVGVPLVVLVAVFLCFLYFFVHRGNLKGLDLS